MSTWLDDLHNEQHTNHPSKEEADEIVNELRKLLHTIFEESHLDRSCSGCEIRDECWERDERWSGCLFVERLEARARELGVDV